MSDQPPEHPFDREYFQSGPYAQVSFARFSQYWWSNRYYARLVRRHGPRQGRALEVGCGLGHLLTWLTDRYQVTGTDVNPWALDEARRNVPQGQFFQLSAQDMHPLEDASFQIMIAKHVVEHLPEPDQALREFSRLLAPGGLLLLATPNLDSPMRPRKKEALDWLPGPDPHQPAHPGRVAIWAASRPPASPPRLLGWLLGRALPAGHASQAAKAHFWIAGGLTSCLWMEYTSPTHG